MSSFDLGYGTNGFANHRLHDAVRVIADLGYTAVGLTLDHHHLDPFAPDLARATERLAALLSSLGLRCVVETGARYLLDPSRKHHPTLVSEAAGRRVDFLRRSVRIAESLDAGCVSFWSGVGEPGVSGQTNRRRLVRHLEPVVAEAQRRGVRLALEPEPGMVVERLDEALDLRRALGEPDPLGITLDVGHCVAVEPVDAAECVRRAGRLLFNVQLDDMLPGVHEHLEFGRGALDLAGTLAALDGIGYRGVAAVELPRHSHAAPQVASEALAALRRARKGTAGRSVGARRCPGTVPEEGTPARDPRQDDRLTAAERRVRERPSAIHEEYPLAGRAPARPAGIDPDSLVRGTADDRARTRLLSVLAEVLPEGQLERETERLYRHGDDAERRGVLRALPVLPASVTRLGLTLVEDGLRSNDPRLVAAAMGPFAAAHLDQPAWRQGVLKCLFIGVPLAAVAGLGRRTDSELLRMARDLAEERRAAGRDIEPDLRALLGTAVPPAPPPPPRGEDDSR